MTNSACIYNLLDSCVWTNPEGNQSIWIPEQTTLRVHLTSALKQEIWLVFSENSIHEPIVSQIHRNKYTHIHENTQIYV